jgi:hypothetical protein
MGVGLSTHILAPRLKKEYSCTSTPRLDLVGLFYGKFYLLLPSKLGMFHIIQQRACLLRTLSFPETPSQQPGVCVSKFLRNVLLANMKVHVNLRARAALINGILCPLINCTIFLLDFYNYSLVVSYKCASACETTNSSCNVRLKQMMSR